MKYLKDMRLFENRPLHLCRNYLGRNVSELNQKQINSIDKVYQRFIALCKRIESKLNCRDCICIYPDQYYTTESQIVLSPYWKFQIFPTWETFNLKLSYSFCFAENLFFSFDCFNKELDIRQFPNYQKTFYTSSITKTIYDFSFIDELVGLIKSIDLSLFIYIRENDHLEIFRSGLFSSFLKEREYKLKSSRLQELNQYAEEIQDKTSELVLLTYVVINRKSKTDFIKIIEDTLAENVSSHISLSQDQKEEDYFQESAQKGKRKEIPPGPRPKPKCRVKNSQTQWPRDPDIKYTALDNASFTCEYDALHTTFISAVYRKPIMHGHHLVPMEMQDRFPVSLDVPDNVICLCPSCHAAIHQAIKEGKIKIIKSFFLSRQEALKQRGINISLSELLSFYKVSKQYIKIDSDLNELNPMNIIHTKLE